MRNIREKSKFFLEAVFILLIEENVNQVLNGLYTLLNYLLFLFESDVIELIDFLILKWCY